MAGWIEMRLGLVATLAAVLVGCATDRLSNDVKPYVGAFGTSDRKARDHGRACVRVDSG